MRFEKGQKVRLDLYTMRGSHGILEGRNNNICIIVQVNHPAYKIKDGEYHWGVCAEMLKPLREVQLLFDFMKG